jgi:hypothetical protein
MRARRSAGRVWPTAAVILYSLGMLSVLAVSAALGGEETSARWGLVVVPAGLFAAASLVVRRGARASSYSL